MNLRISEHQLRFRISRDEVQQLLQQGQLHMIVPLARNYAYSIVLGSVEETLQLNEDDAAWILRVDRQALQDFATQLPSREGISKEIRMGQKTLTLILEVDVRKSPK